MLKMCAKCGLQNLPYGLTCGFCRKPLQDPEDAADGQEKWDALDAKLREDTQKTHEQSLHQLQVWRRMMDSRRGMHMVFGALLFGLPMSLIFLFWWKASVAMLPVLIGLELGVGAAAGYVLNRFGGGGGRGALIFGGAFIVTFVLTLLMSLVDLPLRGTIVRFTMMAYFYGLTTSICVGGLFGKYMVLERTGQ